MGKALVLGGGGVAGVAWETGLLLGLVEAGVDLTDADLVIGTSAGSVVASQVTHGRPSRPNCTSVSCCRLRSRPRRSSSSTPKPSS